MSRHNEPPRAVGQISQNKGRIFDLERRLAPRPITTERECCGETMMHRWRPKAYYDSESWWAADPVSIAVNGSPYQRMKITATAEFEWEGVSSYRVMVSLLSIAGIEASGAMHSFNQDDVYAIQHADMPFITNLTVSTMVDFPMGLWGIRVGGEAWFGSVDTTTGNVTRTEDTDPWLRGVTIEVIEGQVMESQEYWPSFSGPL